MRKNFLFLLGSATGICLTLLVTGPRGGQLIAKAKAGADTYSQLNLFGEVFERVRSDYVEKPNDPQLIEGAITGMVTSLDPHSRYMNDKAWHEMQETTSGSSAGSASKSRWKTVLSRSWHRSTTRRRRRPASCPAI